MSTLILADSFCIHRYIDVIYRGEFYSCARQNENLFRLSNGNIIYARSEANVTARNIREVV